MISSATLYVSCSCLLLSFLKRYTYNAAQDSERIRISNRMWGDRYLLWANVIFPIIFSTYIHVTYMVQLNASFQKWYSWSFFVNHVWVSTRSGDPQWRLKKLPLRKSSLKVAIWELFLSLKLEKEKYYLHNKFLSNFCSFVIFGP